jgi:RNA polymerase sigma factor (sigma-70 family)
MAGPSDVTSPTAEPADADLVRRYLDGDRDALGVIYRRYADRVYDMCAAMLHTADDAADAFQDTFLIAAQKLGGLRDPERLRPWLYSVARNQCRAKIRDRKRTRVDRDPGTNLGVEVDMTANVVRGELAQLMADASLGLNERDQEVLDLHMRHGLEGDDLAEVLEVSTENAYKLVQRVRGRVDRSLGSLLIARHGRNDCPELATVLTGWDGTYSPHIRKRISRHVDDCDTCTRRRMGLLDPGGLASAHPMRPAPSTVYATVLTQIQSASLAVPRAEPAWDDDGFPLTSGPGGRGPKVLTRALVLGITAIAITVGFLAFDEQPADEGIVPILLTTTTVPQEAATTTSAPAVTTFAPTTTAPTTTAPTVTTAITDPAPVTTTTTQPPTTSQAPATTTTTTTTTTQAPPTITSFSATPSTIVENSTMSGAPCGPGETETTLLVVANASTSSVEATWTLGSHSGPTTFVQATSGDWTATFGPFPGGTVPLTGQAVTITATAWDGPTPSASATVAVTVNPC